MIFRVATLQRRWIRRVAAGKEWKARIWLITAAGSKGAAEDEDATGIDLERREQIDPMTMEPEDFRYYTRSEIRGVDEVDHKD